MELFKESFKNICCIVEESLKRNDKYYFIKYEESQQIGEILYDILNIFTYDMTKDELKKNIFLGKYNIISTNHNLYALYNKYFNKMNKIKFDLNFNNFYDFLIFEKSITSFKAILLIDTIEKDELKTNINSFLKMFKNGFKINTKNLKDPLLYSNLIDIISNKQFFDSMKNSLIIDMLSDSIDVSKIKLHRTLDKLKNICNNENIYKIFAFICGIDFDNIIYVFDKLNIYSNGKEIIHGVFQNSKFLKKIKNDITLKNGESGKKLSLIRIIDTTKLENNLTLFDLSLNKPYEMYIVKNSILSFTYSHVQNRLKTLLAIFSNTIFSILDKNEGNGVNIILNFLENLKVIDKQVETDNNDKLIMTPCIKNFNLEDISKIFKYLEIEIDDESLNKMNIFIKEKLHPLLKNYIENPKNLIIEAKPIETFIEFLISGDIKIKVHDLKKSIYKMIEYVEKIYNLTLNDSFKMSFTNFIIFIFEQCKQIDLNETFDEVKNGIECTQKLASAINNRTSKQYKFLDIFFNHLSNLNIKINTIRHIIREKQRR